VSDDSTPLVVTSDDILTVLRRREAEIREGDLPDVSEVFDRAMETARLYGRAADEIERLRRANQRFREDLEALWKTVLNA
jgi:hypothetical protein